MGKVNDEIKKIQIEENLTLVQVFEKYPHLAHLQYQELVEEERSVKGKEKRIFCLIKFTYLKQSSLQFNVSLLHY